MQSTKLALLGAAVVVVLPGMAAAQTVNVYNWSDYIGETTIADFTAATGIDVVYDVYDSNEVLEAKLLAGNAGYDVVVPTAIPFLSRQIKAGVYMELDRSKIPNWANLDPELMKLVETADPGNKYSVIYQWGTVGIGYNEAMVKQRLGDDAPVDSWALVFDPQYSSKLADCGISVLDSPTDVVPAALNYLGLDPRSESPDDLQKAEDLLMQLRPNLKYIHSSQYINDLANGNLCVSVGWSGDVVQAATRASEAGNGNTILYSIPKEGAQVWFDMLAIPVDAPDPDSAHAFINYLLDPAVMAKIDDYVAYANAVPASKPLMDPAISGDTSIFPTPEVQAKLWTILESSPDYDRLRTRSWTRFRTGQ